MDKDQRLRAFLPGTDDFTYVTARTADRCHPEILPLQNWPAWARQAAAQYMPGVE